jgi:hypothetical protein
MAVDAVKKDVTEKRALLDASSRDGGECAARLSVTSSRSKSGRTAHRAAAGRRPVTTLPSIYPTNLNSRPLRLLGRSVMVSVPRAPS